MMNDAGTDSNVRSGREKLMDDLAAAEKRAIVAETKLRKSDRDLAAAEKQRDMYWNDLEISRKYVGTLQVECNDLRSGIEAADKYIIDGIGEVDNQYNQHDAEAVKIGLRFALYGLRDKTGTAKGE